MAERYTSVDGPDGTGITDYGRHNRADMIHRYRAYYRRQLAQATRALAATDEQLRVYTHTGYFTERNHREVTD